MYHAGWAWAGSTPYQGTKLMGAYFGGIRQPMAVSWPKRIKADPTPRPQFHHVIDIVPTIYELTKITPPRVVNGFEQDSIDGVSMVYAFGDAEGDGHAQDAVLRHHGQPRHLPRRLVRERPGPA